MTRTLRRLLVGIVFITASGCGGASTTPFGKTDGSADAAGGGAPGTGGATTTGGVSGTGGTSPGSGGAPASGGAVGTGGAPGTGGRGGGPGTGGSGGTPGTGGRGGTPGTGGRGGTSGSGAAGTSGGGRGGTGGSAVACENLNESACRATPGCRVDTCPGCNGETPFLRCSAMAAPPVLCPAISCPVACDQVTTLADCDARTDCHSVFHDPQTCGCASIGCCTKFLRCAAGDRALCTAPLQIGCDAVVPHCEGPYVVAYTPLCYEGCVRKTECVQ